MKLTILFLLLISSSIILGQPLYLTDYGIVTNDSTKSAANADSLRHLISIANGRVIQLPADTVYIDSININNTNGIRIYGPGVLVYRSSSKTLTSNYLIKFSNCADIELINFNVDGKNGAGSGNGYNNAVLPFYFEGGGAFGENERITISDVNFYDFWWLGFGGELTSAGVYSQVADTIARDVRILRCTWPRVPKRVAGPRGILTQGLVDRIRIEECDFNGEVDGTIYGRGFIKLAAVCNFTIKNNISRNTYDYDYYLGGHNGVVEGNKSINGGKDNFMNLALTSPFNNIPGWQGVGSVNYRNNLARGSGRFISGSPVGFKIDGDLNIIDSNRYESQDTSGYVANHAQVGIIVNGPNNVIINNVLLGRNHELPGFPGQTAILVTDTFNIGNQNIIKDNVIDGWRDGVLIQLDSRNPLITSNSFTNIDSVAVWDYGQDNGRLVSSYNSFFNVRDAYRISGVDTLLQVHETMLDVIRRNATTPMGDSVLVDSLNIRL
ncbi:MAG: hypothetical protein ACRBF0_15045 [Calditrichia bacterium]